MERLVKTCEDVQLHKLARNVTFSGNTVLLVNQMGFDAIGRQNNSTTHAGLARIRSEPIQPSFIAMQSGNKNLSRGSLDCNEDKRRYVLLGWRIAHVPSRYCWSKTHVVYEERGFF